MRVLWVIGICFFVVACNKPNSEKSGKELFDQYCAGCHQTSGKGNFLKGIPANRGTNLSYWQIKLKILRGSGPKSKMPVFKTLTDTDAGKIAEYLQSLSKK